MKVLLTGASGQLGRALVNVRPRDIELTALSHDEFDITDAASAESELRTRKPDLIINAAAYTAVDRAEAEPEKAREVNELGPRNLARAAAAINARMIHVSTDYVFSGDSTRAYMPEDSAEPLGAYGRTKLAGELAVSSLLAGRSVVLRTAWVYGPTGRNFVSTMLNAMSERGRVRVVADQIGTPTATESIARVLWAYAVRPTLHGVYHWTDAGVASWYDFAVAISEEAAALGLLSRDIKVDPIVTDEYPTAARRPPFSLLDSRKTVQAIDMPQLHWRVWLRRVLGDMQGA